MNFSPLDFVRRRSRKYLRKGFGDGLFKREIIQRLLGYRLDGEGRVTEKFEGMNVSYRFDSLPGRCVFLGGEYEEDDARFCLDCIRGIANPVVIDAGANAGFHTLRWLKWRGDLRMLAVEANPETAALLRENVKNNGFGPRCEVSDLALGDREGDVEFILSSDDAFSSLISNQRVPEKRRVKVPMKTLDLLVQEARLDKLDLIKIDVEGAELMVLSGAQAAISQFRPHIFMEIHSRNNPAVAPEETIRRMIALGYEARIVIDGESHPWRAHDDRHANYYFRPSPSPDHPA